MLRLRPYKKSDAQIIAGWHKNERDFRKWCSDQYKSYPVTADDINSYYDSKLNSEFFEMTAFDESGVVGHLTMRFTDEEKTVLRFGFVIVDSAKRGMGYGAEMLKLALDFAFNIVKAQKVTLGIFENNPAAHNCYKSVGFCDVLQETQKHYNFYGEDWVIREMEIKK